MKPILLIRKTDEETDVFQFYPFLSTVDITVNDTLVKKSLSSFDFTKILDVCELSYLMTKCALVYNIKVDIERFEEEIKTKILFDFKSYRSNSYVLTIVLKYVEVDEISNF